MRLKIYLVASPINVRISKPSLRSIFIFSVQHMSLKREILTVNGSVWKRLYVESDYQDRKMLFGSALCALLVAITYKENHPRKMIMTLVIDLRAVIQHY